MGQVTLAKCRADGARCPSRERLAPSSQRQRRSNHHAVQLAGGVPPCWGSGPRFGAARFSTPETSAPCWAPCPIKGFGVNPTVRNGAPDVDGAVRSSPTRWTEGRQIVGSGQESPPASSRQTLCFGQLRARRGSAPLRSPAPGRSRSAVLLFLSPQRLPRRAEPHDRGSLGAASVKEPRVAPIVRSGLA